VTLSLVLCSRNDAYMGNSRWRLETTLNYIGAVVAAMDAPADVEIVVTDWGSAAPLKDVVVLDPRAQAITTFVTVPPELAASLQQDSPFAEVLAINAAARRARGTYIGRIDQDTLVGRQFLERCLDWARQRQLPTGAPMDRVLLFSCRRGIPFRFADACPPVSEVSRLITWFGSRLPLESAPVFYHGGVGVWLLHRDLWNESGGYDERMIYMNDMEIDMADRLQARYPIVDLGPLVGYDFYHLDHYHPALPRTSSAHRRVNAQSPRDSRGLCPSGSGWGLANVTLDVAPAARTMRAETSARPLTAPRALAAFVAMGIWTAADRLWFTTLPEFVTRWTRRARLGWQAVTGQPVVEWPTRLRRAWMDRPSARVRS